MKTLLLSTALVAALGAAAVAQDATTAAPANGTGPFYTGQATGALRASDLIGARIYASEAAYDATEANGVQDGWEDIGEVNDVIVSRDGQVEAVLVDIGGFLGMGERQVAVAMSSLRVTDDASTGNDPDDWFLVMQADRATLEGAPDWNMSMNDGAVVDGTATATGGISDNTATATGGISDTAATDGTATTATGTGAADAPASTGTGSTVRDGYSTLAATELTSEMLDGATVLDSEESSVGTVSNLVIAEDGKITDVIVDVGGFLGLGTKPVALKLEQLEILRQDGGDDLRIFVRATREELEAMPDANL
mgnify:CR=1 FL=1